MLSGIQEYWTMFAVMMDGVKEIVSRVEFIFYSVLRNPEEARHIFYTIPL